MVQTVHLSSMVVLGGMILAGDLRMLNLLMKDIPAAVIIRNTRIWINAAVIMIVLSGIFMLAAVAIKLYYNVFFLVKMISLVLGLGLFYWLRSAVYCRAAGRWIGFS
ncbi:MAG: hypothetical protein KUG79_16180 [Pseudomonadales bacterium]|nr:hypothetical protein [Pseudomonadales bacterium]